MKKIFKIILSITIPIVLIAVPSLAVGLSYTQNKSINNNPNNMGKPELVLPNDKPTSPPNDKPSQKPDTNIPSIPNSNDDQTPTYQKAYFVDDVDDYVPPKPGIGSDTNDDHSELVNGKIPNENYRFIWERSIKIGFENIGQDPEYPNKEFTEYGTGWYLDYLIKDNETYPLTWFMATNLHVVQALKNKEDYSDVRRVDTFKNNSTKTYFLLDSLDNANNTSDVEQIILPTLPKTIFVANDFLEKSPNQMFNNPSFYNPHNMEDMKDFAVIEITFDNIENAKKLTKNIYEKYKNEKLIFAKKTFYNLYQRSEISKLNDVYIGGYPYTSRKFTINKIQSDLDKNNNLGAILSDRTKVSLRNSYSRELIGIMDNFSDYNFWFGIDDSYYKRVGLSYQVELSDLKPGASGSMSINKNKEIIGIYWGMEESTRIGMIDPLISEGFYHDGNYVYPKYDLINGSVKGQKKSWKDSMIKHHKGKISNYFGKL